MGRPGAQAAGPALRLSRGRRACSRRGTYLGLLFSLPPPMCWFALLKSSPKTDSLGFPLRSAALSVPSPEKSLGNLPIAEGPGKGAPLRNEAHLFCVFRTLFPKLFGCCPHPVIS